MGFNELLIITLAQGPVYNPSHWKASPVFVRVGLDTSWLLSDH